MAISSINFLRVSEGLKAFAVLDSLRSNTLKLFEEEQRLATGNRLNAPSDDPVLAAAAVDLTTLFERQEQLLESIRTADTFLGVTDAAIDEIARRGYDPTFGARPLRRVIQQRIQNPLAVEMLKHRLSEGSAVCVDYQTGEFTFERIDPTLVETAN